MKQPKLTNETGFLLIKLLLLIVVMVVGYFVITRVLHSKRVQDATSTVDSAKNKADKVLE